MFSKTNEFVKKNNEYNKKVEVLPKVKTAEQNKIEQTLFQEIDPNSLRNTLNIPKDTFYAIIVSVNNTLVTKGNPGHVAMQSVEISATNEINITSTSFYPNGLRALPHAMFFFGAVPVKGYNSPRYKNDLNEADLLLIKPLTKEEYLATKEQQHSFEKRVKEGTNYYSIFHNVHPMTKSIVSFIDSLSNGFSKMIYNAPYSAEDLSGNPVSIDEYREPVPVSNKKVYNCTTAVEETISVIPSLNLSKGHVVPSSFGEHLKSKENIVLINRIRGQEEEEKAHFNPNNYE